MQQCPHEGRDYDVASTMQEWTTLMREGERERERERERAVLCGRPVTDWTKPLTTRCWPQTRQMRTAVTSVHPPIHSFIHSDTHSLIHLPPAVWSDT